MFCGHKWKKSLVDDEANRLIFRSFEYRLTFTPPTPGFKGIVFQQSMWGGQDTLKNETKCRISLHFVPPDLSKTLKNPKPK